MAENEGTLVGDILSPTFEAYHQLSEHITNFLIMSPTRNMTNIGIPTERRFLYYNFWVKKYSAEMYYHSVCS